MNDMEKKQSDLNLPGSVKICAAVLGPGSLVYFLIFLIFYTRVTMNLHLSVGYALFMDTVLSVLFFFQHSVMVRKSFKRLLIKWVPEQWLTSVYAMASGITLICVIFFWQGTGKLFLDMPMWGKVMMGICILLSLAGFQWGSSSLPGFDPFGIRPPEKGPPKKPVLKFRGPYQYMRHPLYFFTLTLIWSSTVFTLDRLLFNLLWTGWIFLGAWLEEKDLVGFFGEDYRKYQHQTPMIVPVRWPKTGNRSQSEKK